MQDCSNSTANALELLQSLTKPSIWCIWQKPWQNWGLIFVHGHYSDVIMSAIASQITSVSIVCLTVCSAANQWKLQSSASLAFMRGIHRWPANSLHKRPVTQNMFPFDDVIMVCLRLSHEKLSTSHSFLWDIISHQQLTHWGRNKKPNNMTFSNAFSWMKMFEFWLIFQWSLFP